MASGFRFKAISHITLKSIAQNATLDPIFAKHEPILDAKLATANEVLERISDKLRNDLRSKLALKQEREGKKAITDADRRRWDLPKQWQRWTVPFDTDPNYPADLKKAVEEYRAAWRAKMDEVNACIAANAEQEELVDQPEVDRKITRVSGPFTVEAVQPPEMSLGDAIEVNTGQFAGEPEELGESFTIREVQMGESAQNIEAYLAKMVDLLRMDGVRFPEDRVLWRADGRETGPALADLDGDGRLEILTTLFQPGELLSSTGRPIRMFAIDAPYWPVKNSSSPAVARLTPTGESVLLFVGPSGYLYAYDSAGHLNWRTEIGGEALGGPAVGPLLPGGKPGVAVAWTGGVSVIDAAGRLVWQRQLPVPYGASPVLVDLDQDGLMEIVVNAGSSLVALHGSTGRAVWEYSIEGSRFATVAAGEFIKGGKPRVVAGDDQGVVYALDESGKALWHQDRIYGPREVPEPVERYAGIFQVGLADLDRTGERKIVASTRSGETVALSARGERLWRFASYERRVGISLGRGAYLAFADLDNDGKLEVILSQQDSYVYVLGADGREKWSYLGYFWYHFPPVVGDLQGTGELNLVFTSPEPGGTYALRSGSRGKPGRNPWPMAGGSLTRANCAPW
ncbi:MAG: PQQ-binding-like beta-propeller repeat protein [Bryobacterales bacterium]|nr:PQQ-binding-like beta-propeller repeat protein [Bryobacterales bacterium]